LTNAQAAHWLKQFIDELIVEMERNLAQTWSSWP